LIKEGAGILASTGFCIVTTAETPRDVEKQLDDNRETT